VTVVVRTKARKQPSGILDFYRGLPEDRARVLEIVDNPEEIVSYDTQKPKRVGKGTSIVDPSEDYDYVVITSKALNSSNGDYTFQDLVAWKNQKGVKATIVTVERILNEPAYHCGGTYGDGCAIPEFNDTAAHIRNFIKDAYQNWGIKYVLLGGDGDGADVGGESGNDIIPCRGFYGFVDSPGTQNNREDAKITADLKSPTKLNPRWDKLFDPRLSK